jgi:type I restriction enzyme M protein
MRKGGKDNSGDKVYVKRSAVLKDEKRSPLAPLKKGGKEENSLEVPLFKGDLGGSEFLLDSHGHLIVEHDLFNHDGLTEDGIAEAFMEFAKKENLSFFDLSSSVTPFDAEKYDRLMDELEASEVSYKKVVEESYSARIDSTFFQQEFLQSRLNQINSWHIDEICLVRSGTTPVERDENLKEGVVLLKTNDIRNNVLTNNNIEDLFFIDEATNTRMKNTQLQFQDVLLNIVGATTDVIGRSALVTQDFPKANITQAMCLLRIKDKQSIDPSYLFLFLCCFYGNQQIRRIARPTGQYNMNLVEVGSIKLPVVSFEFQKTLKTLVTRSHFLLESSKNIYTAAEDLLLSELGLKDWQPTDENIAVKSFSASFGKSDRLDAEHYQPKFDQLTEKIEQKVNLSKLGELLTWNQRGKQPSYFEEDQNILDGLPVVNSKHVREGEVILVDNRYAKYQPEDKPLIIQTNDVLINGTGVGTIGRCAPYLHKQNALPDNHVTILRTNVLDPVYLSIYINSIAGQYQVEKYLKGSSGQTELYPKDIDNFWVWEAPDKIQQRIKNKVEEAHQKREQSKQLLEIAKTGVEKAIEENEEVATNWISQQLKNLEIKNSPPFLRGAGGDQPC